MSTSRSSNPAADWRKFGIFFGLMLLLGVGGLVYEAARSKPTAATSSQPSTLPATIPSAAGTLESATDRARTAAEKQSSDPDSPRAAKRFRADQFLRYLPDDTHPRLETSVFTLKGNDGFTLDLISAVHVADAAYYAELNRRFQTYDAVLYELVRPEGAGVPIRGQPRKASAVSGVQRGLKTVLGLTFQLDEVDYTPDNFVHADLSAEAFADRQAARGESLPGLMMQAYVRALTQPPAPSTSTQPVRYRRLQFGNTPESRQLALKTLLASIFGDLERQSLGLDSPGGSAILTDRNDAAIEVVHRVRAEGRKHVALFYGAAHMPDMATQLVEKESLTPSPDVAWLTAWDLTPPPTTQPAR